MEKIIWPWVNHTQKEIPGIAPVFEIENFRRELIKACVKCGLGVKTGKSWYQYQGKTRTLL